MSITEVSVRRPAAIFMAVLLVIGLGIIGYMNLGADLFPSINTPVITIFTDYNGAGVDEIEKAIIKPIEDEVSAINGIDTLRSGAAVGYGYTIIKFKMDVDINTAFLDVQQALGDISSKLPENASTPVIKKVDKNASSVMMVSVSGQASYEELYDKADDIKQSLEKLQGVGSVTLEGCQVKEVLIQLDKTAIEYYGISPNAIINKLKVENIDIPAGNIKQDSKSQTLKVNGEFKDINDIKNLCIPVAGGNTIPLSEIANVDFQYPDKNEILRLNGINSIGVFIQKQSDANIIETTNLVKKELNQIEKSLPEVIQVTIAKDQSTFINSTLNDVKKTLVEGIFITSLVLLIFLRQWRPALIILVAIPTSLVATFFMMYVFHFTLNMMTLLGLSLCIGILVDDSIVVLENIQRHLKMGKDPIRAAIDGRKEIGMAAIAITLCDVVVFGPVAFMSDIVGQFFKQFGLTVVFATLFSLAVSFTVTPMLAAKLLRKEEITESKSRKIKKQSLFSNQLEKAIGLYKKVLIWCLENRWKVIIAITVAVVLSISLIPLKLISTEFLPSADQGKLTMNMSLAPGSTLSQTDEHVKEVESHLKSMPEIKDFFSQVGIGNNEASAEINVNLVDKSKRKKSQDKIAEEIRTWGNQLAGVNVSISGDNLVGKTSIDGSKPVAINILGNNAEALKKLSDEVEAIVKSVPGITDVENSSNARQSELNVNIDRLAASEYGISAADIATTLRTAVLGTTAGVYRKNGDEYDIVVKFDENEIKTSSDTGSIMITNSIGQQVRLEQVATILTNDSPQQQLRQNKQELISISANIEERALGDVNKDIKKKLETLSLPSGYQIEFGGDQQNMTSSFASLGKALIASIILVYMIMVVLYESYLTPFIRMLSLPCGIIGALTALVITGNTLNLVSMIGLIMLDGMASKNGTLLIDYTNTLMKRGLPLKEALIEAGTTRIRPILMTSVTMIAAMLPSALALGSGSEIISSMAVALVGGMITSTLLSPFLLPVVYTIMDDIKKFFQKKKEAKYLSTVGGVDI